MKQFKDVVIMYFNEVNRQNYSYNKPDSTAFPESCPMTFNFIDTEVIGIAKNFRVLKDRVICDIDLKKEEYLTPVTDTVSLQILAADVKQLEDKSTEVEIATVINASIIAVSANDKLNHNLKEEVK